MSNGKPYCRMLYLLARKVKSAMHKVLAEPIVKRSFACCGVDVHVAPKCSFAGIGNVHVGSHVALGVGTRFMTTRAKILLGDYIMFGPGVTIITGDHRVDVLGKYMYEISDQEKRPEDDQDVVIENDVWIGANVTILKGVTIGKGSVVAAGAVVTKSCPPYSVVGGVPAKVIKPRWTEAEIEEHESRVLNSKGSIK